MGYVTSVHFWGVHFEPEQTPKRQTFGVHNFGVHVRLVFVATQPRESSKTLVSSQVPKPPLSNVSQLCPSVNEQDAHACQPVWPLVTGVYSTQLLQPALPSLTSTHGLAWERGWVKGFGSW